MDIRPLVVGNWKMELSHKGASEVFAAFKKMMLEKNIAVDVVVCPSYPSLSIISESAQGTTITIGAQNVHDEERGAFTGAVSAVQLRDFVSWCIVGHSEVRAREHDTDDMVLQKAKLLLQQGITPIVCIGETEEQRTVGHATQIILAQLDGMMQSFDRVSLLKTVIAYEPIWAIGSGQLPDPNEVYEIMLLIRKQIANTFDKELADRIRLLYGGSIKAENAKQYVIGAGTNGLLVGGASVHPRDFFEIISSLA